MFRDLLSGSRAIFVGFVFFVLVVGGSLLYSWHVQRMTDAEVAETHRKVQPHENENEIHTVADTVDTSEVDFEQTPLETNDTQPIAEETAASTDDEAENVDLTDIFLPEDFVSEEAPDEDVPVSPFGFGPYPEVPADYFGVPIWMQDSGLPDHAQREIELIDRVLVKLWQQGDRSIVGGSTYNGKILPHYENTAYIRWSESVSPNGTIHRYISRVKGASNAPTAEEIESGDIPAGFNLLDLDDAGVDPYVFLDLEN